MNTSAYKLWSRPPLVFIYNLERSSVGCLKYKTDHTVNSWHLHIYRACCRSAWYGVEVRWGGWSKRKTAALKAPDVDKKLYSNTFPTSTRLLAFINPLQCSQCWKDNQTQHNWCLYHYWNLTSPDLEYSSCCLFSWSLSPIENAYSHDHMWPGPCQQDS